MITKLQVKYIQSLGQKKLRDEAGIFVAEGPKIINELLAALPASLQSLYAEQQWLEAHAPLVKNIDPGKIIVINTSELERISFLQTRVIWALLYALPTGLVSARLFAVWIVPMRLRPRWYRVPWAV